MFPETENLYYINHRQYHFDAKVVGILSNVEQKTKGKNIILLNRSAFYPTSGGQVHDTGVLKIGDKSYHVINVEKVGKCFLHYLDQEVDQNIIGKEVKSHLPSQNQLQLQKKAKQIIKCQKGHRNFGLRSPVWAQR